MRLAVLPPSTYAEVTPLLGGKSNKTRRQNPHGLRCAARIALRPRPPTGPHRLRNAAAAGCAPGRCAPHRVGAIHYATRCSCGRSAHCANCTQRATAADAVPGGARKALRRHRRSPLALCAVEISWYINPGALVRDTHRATVLGGTQAHARRCVRTQGAACARKVQPLALAASGVLAGGTQGSALW